MLANRFYLGRARDVVREKPDHDLIRRALHAYGERQAGIAEFAIFLSGLPTRNGINTAALPEWDSATANKMCCIAAQTLQAVALNPEEFL